VPVDAGEGQGGGADADLRVAGQRYGHIAGRLARQLDVVAAAAAFGDRGGHDADHQAAGVVVDVGDRDIRRIEAVVEQVRGGCDAGGDGVGDIAVIDEIVDAGDGHG